MTRSLWTLALSALFVGMVAVGCGDEDYSDLDAEYAKMEEGMLTRHGEAMSAYDEMNKDFSTVTVADDWDTNRRMAYDVAKTRMGEYNTQLQEGKTQSAKWKSDLEAAKKEGREAYQAKLAEARTWFDQYNAWLDAYNSDIERYRSTVGSGGTDPWWFVMYGPTPAAGNTDTDTGASTADADDDGDVEPQTADEKAGDADGADDDKNAIKEGIRDVIGDDDND